MSRTVAVIGAGITGAFTAFLLARGGQQVVLLDGETAPHRGTSCNPGGINPLHGPGLPQPMAHFYLSSHSLHAAVRSEVMSLSGIDYGFRTIDRLFLAFSPEEKRSLLAMGREYDSRQGFSAQWYGPDRLQALDMRISEHALGGLFTHGNAVVDSELYCEALVRAACKLGCRYIRRDVINVVARAGRVSHVETVQDRLACDIAVLATGYHRDKLCASPGYRIPVEPLKGELLVATLAGKPLEFDVTRGLAGLYQYQEGMYWLGGTRTRPGKCPGVTVQGRNDILRGIYTMLPGLEPVQIIAQRVGYRPQSVDRLPLVGLVPGFSNLLLATGGGSKGILVSAGIAQTVCKMVVEGATAAIPYLSPGRFEAGE